MSMTNYSKWDHLEDSDSEEEAPRQARVTRLDNPSSITFGGSRTGAKGAEPIKVVTPASGEAPPRKAQKIATKKQQQQQPAAAPSKATAAASSAPTPAAAEARAAGPLTKGGLSSSYSKWDSFAAALSDSDEEEGSGSGGSDDYDDADDDDSDNRRAGCGGFGPGGHDSRGAVPSLPTSSELAAEAAEQAALAESLPLPTPAPKDTW